MGACGSAVSYLRQALAATEGLADADEEVTLKRDIFQQLLVLRTGWPVVKSTCLHLT